MHEGCSGNLDPGRHIDAVGKGSLVALNRSTLVPLLAVALGGQLPVGAGDFADVSAYHTSAGLPDPSTVPQYGIFELTLAQPADYGEQGNFFDIKVGVTFTAPSKQTTSVGGFYYDTLADGVSLWKVRFAPGETGAWTYTYRFRHKRGGHRVTGGGSFSCIPGDEPGFVRQSQARPFRWVFDNGQPFVPIGFNDCLGANDIMQIDGGDRHGAFTEGETRADQYLDAYAQAGFNMFRFSQSNCSPALANQSLTVYSKDVAGYFDWFAQRLRSHDFRIFYGIFGYLLPGDPPTPLPAEVRRFVKYSVNRWGAYVDVWELQNERRASSEWITKVAARLRAKDPYQHPITTSWQRPELEAIEINAPHWYQHEDELQSDLRTAQNARNWKSYGKPVVVGEQGNSTPPRKEFGNWLADSALRMRIRSWTAFFNEMSFLFWNTSWATNGRGGGAANIYLGPEERQYTHVLQWFADLAARRNTQMSEVTVSNKSLLRAYGLTSSDGAAVYLHHYANHKKRARSQTVTVDIPQSGRGHWIDPATGKYIGSVPVAAGRRELTIPDFVIDIAFLSSAADPLSTPPLAIVSWDNPQADGDLDNDGRPDYGPEAPPFGIAPLKLALDGSASYDLDGGSLSYRWRFGDGTPDLTGPIVAHVYDAGVYMTTLTVTDDEGQQAGHSFVVRVTGDSHPRRNDAPTFNRPRDITVREGELALITPWAIDRELERDGYVTDKLSYRVTGLPNGASFGERGTKWSKQFWWVPGFSQSGVYEVAFEVWDDDGASPPPQRIAITVLDARGSPGDLDFDGDVDLDDFAKFGGCMAGPGTPSPKRTCDDTDFAGADLDHDNDVDLHDFTLFLAVFGR